MSLCSYMNHSCRVLVLCCPFFYECSMLILLLSSLLRCFYFLLLLYFYHLLFFYKFRTLLSNLISCQRRLDEHIIIVYCSYLHNREFLSKPLKRVLSLNLFLCWILSKGLLDHPSSGCNWNIMIFPISHLIGNILNKSIASVTYLHVLVFEVHILHSSIKHLLGKLREHQSYWLWNDRFCREGSSHVYSLIKERALLPLCILYIVFYHELLIEVVTI